MSRVYKIGEQGKIMSGEELVKKAQALFKTEVHGLGSSGRPTTVKKAITFVERELKGKNVYTRTDTEPWHWVGSKVRKGRR